MADKSILWRFVLDAKSFIGQLTGAERAAKTSMENIEGAAKKPAASLKAVNNVSKELQRELENLSDRAGVLSGAFSAFGPAGIAAGAAIATLSAGFVAGTRELDKYETSVRKLEKSFIAAGNSTGLTIGQIKGFAEELSRSTLLTEEQVFEMAAALNSMGTIGGDNLKRLIALGQDFSSVYGGDAKSSVEQWAAALTNPEEGLGRLDTKTKGLLKSNQGLIDSLLQAGRQSEATALFIETLEGRIGGLGKSDGLTGATDQLSKSWDDVLKSIGNTGPIISAINSLTKLNQQTAFLINSGLLSSLLPGNLARGLMGGDNSAANLASRQAQDAKAVADFQKQLDGLLRQEKTGREQVDRIAKTHSQNRKEEIKDISSEQKKALLDWQKQQEELAKKSADLWNQPILRAAENMQDAFTDAFEKIFSGGVNSFSDLSGQIKGIFTRLLAEIASVQLVQPLASGLFGGLLSAPGGASGGGAGGALNLLGNASTLSSLFGGPSLSGALGLGGISSAIGNSIAGAITGTAALPASFIGAPTAAQAATAGLGATIGSFALPIAGIGLGLLAGGLFSKKPSNKSAGAFIDPNTGGIYQDLLGTVPGVVTPKGTENLARFNQVAQTVTAALTQIKEFTGGTFGGGLFNLALGSRDPGFTVFGDKKTTFANDEALAFGAVKNALQYLTGVSPEFQSAISGSTAKNLNDLLAQISLPRRRSDYNTAIGDELLQLTDPTAFALKQLEREREARIKEAQEIGADIAEVERLYGEKRRQVVEQTSGSIYQQQKTLTDALLGPLSALGGLDKYNLARSQFDSTAALALSGDAASRAAFGDIFNQFLSVSRDFNSSGAAYKDDFSRAVAVYQQVLGANQLNLSSAANNAVIESIERQTAISQDNTKLTVDKLQSLIDQFTRLMDQFRRMDNRPAGSLG